MGTSWHNICELESAENYPAAIEALEERLRMDPGDYEAVIRLGFDYWLAIAEHHRLALNVSLQRYAARFLELLRQHEATLSENADFCFAYGLGLSMDYYNFAPQGNDEQCLREHEILGKELLARAARLDPFYARLCSGKVTQDEIAQHFSGRTCFAQYYGVT